MIAKNIRGVLYLNLGRIGSDLIGRSLIGGRRDLIGRRAGLSGKKMALFGRKMSKVTFVRVLNIFFRVFRPALVNLAEAQKDQILIPKVNFAGSLGIRFFSILRLWASAELIWIPQYQIGQNA